MRLLSFLSSSVFSPSSSSASSSSSSLRAYLSLLQTSFIPSDLTHLPPLPPSSNSTSFFLSTAAFCYRIPSFFAPLLLLLGLVFFGSSLFIISFQPLNPKDVDRELKTVLS